MLGFRPCAKSEFAQGEQQFGSRRDLRAWLQPRKCLRRLQTFEACVFQDVLRGLSTHGFHRPLLNSAYQRIIAAQALRPAAQSERLTSSRPVRPEAHGEASARIE